MLDPEKAIPDLTLDDLNRMYLEGEECDKRMFAEMRTNLQLVAGDHYVREGSRFWNRVRDNKQLTQEQRLKLTKNHIQRASKIYRNSIEQYSPDVGIEPADQKSMQSQKQAELNQSYWEYIKECNDMKRQVSSWIKDFVDIGELCTKVFWDMNGGQIIGYEPMMVPNPMNPDELIPQEDGQGGYVQDTTKPVYGGKVKFETFEAYNLRRDPDARSMKESPYLMLSKLLPKRALRTLMKDAEARQLLDNAPTNEYTIYDNNTGYYRVAKGQVLVKECYFRPAPQIPNGYYFIFIDNKVVQKGELPYGIFPIIHTGFDEQTGNPRSHSFIRHVRPAQIEINRCASAIAEAQVTNGADKVWVSATTKVSQGAFLPGTRVNTYSGMKPEFQPGRNGEQYFDYLSQQIDELYRLANLDEVVAENQTESPDLYTNLLKSFRFRRKFAIYGEKFERFLCEVVKTALQIAKYSASEQELVPALGRSEYINMSEFKNSEDIHYSIKVKPRSDDVETQFGQQITLNNIIQYVGQNLEKEDLGRLIRLSPFLNKEQMLEPLTMKYDNLVNDMLALDRGQWRPPRKYDDHKYIIQGLANRMSKADYEFLPQPVKFLYEQKIQMHEELQAQALIEIQRAQAGFIPSGGYMVACDFYEGDPNNPGKSKRVRIPSESVNWLINALKKQGTELLELADQPVGVQQELAEMVGNARAMAASTTPRELTSEPMNGDPFNAQRTAA